MVVLILAEDLDYAILVMKLNILQHGLNLGYVIINPTIINKIRPCLFLLIKSYEIV